MPRSAQFHRTSRDSAPKENLNPLQTSEKPQGSSSSAVTCREPHAAPEPRRTFFFPPRKTLTSARIAGRSPRRGALRLSPAPLRPP